MGPRAGQQGWYRGADGRRLLKETAAIGHLFLIEGVIRVEQARIRVFDTTLRDGEQSPGATLYPAEKVRLAHQLARLGVDTIEPGFPASSPGEFAAVQTISRDLQDVEICGFARAVRGDIDAAVQATADAARRRLHLFVSSSQIHLDFQLHKSRAEVLELATAMVGYAKQFVDEIEFSPMDASRTELPYLIEMVEAVIGAGATIVNLPDTVGYALPHEYGRMFSAVRTGARGAHRVAWSAHCHNDLGLAVANTLAAIENGATHVEVTVNGIGERAGNCSLEELAMALETRGDSLPYVTGINSEQIYETSRACSRLMNYPVAHNKAVVGRNAFAHEAGIHQDGLLKNRRTYEIMDPERMGIPRTMIVLGKHSGRHALRQRISDFGVELTDVQLDSVFRDFKQLADAQKRVPDEKLIALVDSAAHVQIDALSLLRMQAASNSGMQCMASVALRDNRTGEERTFSGTGEGPVEALTHAILHALPIAVEFRDLELHSLSSSEAASGEAVVTVAAGGREFSGVGVDRDILLAVAQGLLSACNQALRGAPAPVATGVWQTRKETTP